jgi:hypothetical protein
MADLIKGKDPAIASYSFQDIEDASGMVQYNAYSAATPSSSEYILAKDTPFGGTMDGNNEDTSTFNTGEFNTPRVIGGTITTNVMFFVASGSSDIYFSLKLFHYDGSSQTQMGDTYTKTCPHTGSGRWHNLLVKIDVPNTKFKRGEQLQLEVEVHGFSAPIEGDRIWEYGINPQNIDGDYITPSTDASHFTTFKLNIPFRIDT